MSTHFKQVLKVASLLLLGVTLFLLAQVPRENFLLTFILFALGFGGMIGSYFLAGRKESFWLFLGLGVIFRVSIFFFAPQWSEDGVRFLWDGELLRQGQNPYFFTPAQVLAQQGEAEAGYRNQLFEELNSPTYFSVYPPLNQAVFWVVAQIAQGHLEKGYWAIRCLLLLAEVGVFSLLWWLLSKFQLPQKQVIFYWFNPLVILEVVGNLHFEGLVLFFLLASIASLSRQKLGDSGMYLGLAIGMKLLPLLLALSFLFWREVRTSVRFWGLAIGIGLLCFLPLVVGGAWQNFFQSLQLYQGKFEFNASVYYLFRAMGYWWVGYNVIGVLTKIGMVITVFGVIWMSWKRSKATLEGMIGLWVQLYLLYFLLQPVVHPWYLLPGLALSILTRQWTFLLWSFGAIFSYQAYSQFPVEEKPFFLFLEYGLVFFGLYLDYFRKERTNIFG
ncbi:MAG: glycosyltransferase 87 family protein [Bacteroidetes bacterium]|nr:glycosyltransferase 87 family protein [Bacteroidota bacterium]